MARKDLKVGRMNLLVQCVRNLPCVKECSNYGILKVLLTDTDLFFFWRGTRNHQSKALYVSAGNCLPNEIKRGGVVEGG